ncbi:MAG: U32 family peptidase [Clostridia bacterium]|nr:U32 family peptidase [Clostridia bacterium]
MDKKVELLAPAGEWDAFVAAVENGADAVYLGGKLFNARQFAGNFDNEQLKKAVEYAHIRDVNVYLALNTLMSDSELPQALEFITMAYLMGIDGVIVQDIGAAALLREAIPDLPLHASTQMTIYNLQGVRLLEKMGFSRIVLARELSLDEISYISANTNLEIETFIHGALCISYSGQCLMSSIIGGRSGNRGKCAQPCRLPYELNKDGNYLEVKGKYLLSPKDICSVHELKRIIDAGVKSLKIEGRMKNPEYVATVVRIYRKYIDGAINNGGNMKVSQEDEKTLAQVFNRGGLSGGYLGGKTGIDMMCFEKPKNWGIYLGEVLFYDKEKKTVKVRLNEEISLGDGIEVWNGENESPGTVVSEIKINNINKTAAAKGEIAVIGDLKGRITKGNKVYKTSDKNLNTMARESFSGKYFIKTNLEAYLSVVKGQPAALIVSDERGNTVTVKGERIAEDAISKPLTEERVIEQLGKTGASPFRFTKIEVNLEKNLSLPISEINDIRRKALEEMEARRANRYLRNIGSYANNSQKKISHFPGNGRKKTEGVKISLHFSNMNERLDIGNLGADRLYIPFAWMLDKKVKEITGAIKSSGCEVYLWLPSITRGNYDKLIENNLPEIIKHGVDGILAGNPGIIEYMRNNLDIKVMGDYSLNIFNSVSIDELNKLGLEGAVLSPELNLGQIKDLEAKDNFRKEAIVYGRIPLMTSEYCPVGSIAGGFGKNAGCSAACRNGVYRLRDRMGMEFPVLCDRIDCRSVILNSNVLFVPDSLDKISKSGVDSIRLNFTDEQPDDIYEIIRMHRDVLSHGISAAERYSSLIRTIKEKGFTKGHFFRGV